MTLNELKWPFRRLWLDVNLQYIHYISESSSTPWGPTSQPLSERATRLYVTSGECGDLCHIMPCWPWFVHWLSVRLECRRPFGFLSEAVKTHNPTASWTPLVESSFRLSVLAYRCLHGTVPAYLAESLLRTSNVDTRRRLRSADSAMLVVPSIRRSTLGDRAFPVASARAWNSLPSFVRNAPSLTTFRLTTFRRELKTVLFRSSFDND